MLHVEAHPLRGYGGPAPPEEFRCSEVASKVLKDWK